jgi:dipeptidase E
VPTDLGRRMARRFILKPIADSNALCIPTAQYGHPTCTPASAWEFIAGQDPSSTMCALGWKSLGVLELTALPTIGTERFP